MIFLADKYEHQSDVHVSAKGTAHNVSASHDYNAPHWSTIPTKVEDITFDTHKPPNCLKHFLFLEKPSMYNILSWFVYVYSIVMLIDFIKLLLLS